LQITFIYPQWIYFMHQRSVRHCSSVTLVSCVQRYIYDVCIFGTIVLHVTFLPADRDTEAPLCSSGPQSQVA